MPPPDGGEPASAANPVTFNIAGARQAGYSDAEIADYLGGQANFNAGAARQAGYGDDDIINYLAVQPKPPPPPSSTLAGIGKAAAPIPTDIGGALIKAGGEMVTSAGTGLQSAASNAEDFTRQQIGIINRIDAGGKVATQDDPLGYADASPEQRGDIRKALEADIATLPASQDTGLGQAGQAVKTAGGAVMGAGDAVTAYGQAAHPLTDEEQRRFSVQAVQTGGGLLAGLLPYFGAAALGGMPAVMGLAGVQGFGEHYEAAEKAGASDADAATAGLFGGMINAGLMTVPMHKAMEVAAAIPKALQGQFLKTVWQAVESGTTLTAFSQLQTVADNVVAGTTYDPTRNPTKDVGKNLAWQFAAGAILPFAGAGMNAAGRLAGRAFGRPNVQPRPAVADVVNAPDIDTAINTAAQVAAAGTPIDVDAEVAQLATGDSADLQQAALLKLFHNTDAGTVEATPAGGYQFRTVNAAGDEITHPIEVWNPDITPTNSDGTPTNSDDGTSTISADTANALRAHYGQAGVDVVFYKEDGAIPFDGVIDPSQPDTIFLSSNPDRNVAQVAAHEFTHVLQTTTLPDGTNLNDVLNQQVAASITPAGQRYAQSMFGSTAPKRAAFPDGPEGDAAHSDAVQAHLINELGADIGGEAPKFQTFLPRVVNAIQQRFGGTVAGDVLGKLIDGLSSAMKTIRGLFTGPDGEFGGTRSQNWVTNLGEIHDTLAQMYAARFGTPVEREQAALAAMKDRAERNRFTAEQQPPAPSDHVVNPVTPEPGAGVTPEPGAGDYRAIRDATQAKALKLRRWLDELATERDAAAASTPKATILTQTEAAILHPVGGDETALPEAGKARLDDVRQQIDATTHPTADTPEMAKVRDELGATAEALTATDYVTTPEGSPDLGRIDETMAAAIGSQPAPIRLTRGAEAHIEERHAQLEAHGYASAANFVQRVATGFDEIWQARNDSLLLVMRRSDDPKDYAHSVYVLLQPASDGHAWEVQSGGVFRRAYPGGTGRKLLWQGERTSLTGTGDQVPLATQPGPDQQAGTEPRHSAGRQSISDMGEGSAEGNAPGATPGVRQPNAPPERPPGYGANNKMFTAEMAEKARARLRERLSRLNTGFDPALTLDGLTLAGYHIEAGARSFAAYSKAMLDDLGDLVRPHLKQFYNAVRDHPGFDTVGMDDHATVEAESKRQAAEAAAAEAPPPSQSLVPAPEPPNPVAVPENPDAKAANADHALAERVAERLDRQRVLGDGARDGGLAPLTARELQTFAEQAYGGTLAQGAYSRDRLYDAIELGVNRYIQNHPERFSPAVDAPLAEQAARELAALKDSLPTQTVRAGEKDAYQQFSTPPDYAYAANWVANLRPGDHVLEPSGGVGGLVVHAMNAGVRETTVNELSDKRRGMIALLKPTRVAAEDAAQLHNILPADVRPTVVVMNPPFSRAAERMGGRMVLDEGAKHIEQALARLEPGGRLVAIVGDGMKPEGTASEGTRGGGTGKAFGGWWKKIGAAYDVRANVGVDRDIYTKYGTSFPTRFLVIDKNAPSGRPMITGQVRDAAELIERLRDVRDDRSTVEPVADQSGRPEVAAGGEGVPDGGSELPGPTGGMGVREGAGGRAAPDVTQPTGATQPGVRGGRPPRVRGGGGRVRDPMVPVESESGVRGTGGQPGGRTGESEEPAGSRSGGGGDGIRPDGSGERDSPGVTPAPEVVVATENAVSESGEPSLSEAVYEPYRPQNMSIAGAKPHPGALVQSAAMASVRPPPASHNLAIPDALIKGGALSDAQLEAIVYAGQAHSDILPNGKRRGFFIGDGTGTGKGREIAGVILDNWMKGQARAVWVSEKRALVNDAKRDWNGMGRPASDIIDHGKMKPGDDIKADKGILFTSYDTLKSAEQTKTKDGKVRGKERVDQIIDWLGKDFDGVIAFDEAHNMGNATDQKGSRGVKKAAQKALAGMKLQEALPNARVVYVSATGATEVSNLAYADRLGLWGEGTAFPNRNDFLGQVSSGGIAGMELVARDMKALGHYIARNLSYDGVDYDRVEHVLSPDQRVTYDKLAEGWQLVLQHFNAALEASGVTEDGKTKNSRAKSAAMSAFWGAHQRFFNQIITSMQMPSVIRGVEADLQAGRQAVLQLVNTMEAAQERALEKARASGDGEIEDLDMTPRDQLMQLIEKSYPIQQMEEYVDDNGNLRSRPAVDSEGKPVINQQLVAARDRLLDEIGSLRVPDGPLEMLLNHFGTDKVAEVTGRGQRVVRKPDESGQMKTVVEQRGAGANVGEANSFQDGKKPILVFSEAGGTGRSYHAAIGSGSENARRSHYLVQGGWRADKAVQGFGRTHRTNQASAPIFHLVTTDLQGQKRFISSIARRLAQLGALTKGERRSADQGMFGMRDNLESTEAKDGLRQFFRDVNMGAVEGVTMDDLEQSMGLKMRDENGALASPPPEMSQFLNRVLSLKIDHQNRVFQAFSDRMDLAIARASAAGTLDTGVETYQADKISKISEQTVYTDPRSGAETKHVHLNAQNRNEPIGFAETLAGRNKTNGARPDTFIQNKRSGRVFAVTTAGNYTDTDGRIVPQVRLTSPIDYQFLDREKVDANNWKRLTVADAKPLWDAQVAATPEYRNSALHIITGAVLPIWDRLGGNPKIFRLQTDQGERMLGRVIPATHVDATLRSLGAEGIKVTASPGEIGQQVLNGATARLANGWTIKRSLVAGEPRIELVGPDYRYGEELARAGVFSERIAYNTRYFIPTGPADAAAAIESITKTRPVTALEGAQFSPRRGGGDVQYSPRPVADLTGEEIAPRTSSLEQLRAAARSFYDRVLRRTTVYSSALKGDIRFEGAKKAFHTSANPDKLRLFAALRDVLANGTLISSEAPRDPRVEGGTKAYHYLVAPVDLAGKRVMVGATIREDTNGHLYYNHNLHEDRAGSPDLRPDGTRLTKPDLEPEEGGTTRPGDVGFDQNDVNLEVSEVPPVATKGAEPKTNIGGAEDNKKGTQFSPRPEEDRPPFFSALTRAVEGVKQEKATPGQWIATIKNMAGVKAEERAWSGVEDWLGRQPKSVTKGELLDYLRENEVQVREVTKGAPIETPEIAAKRARFQELSDRDESAARFGGERRGLTSAETAELDRLANELLRLPNPWLSANTKTRYHQYALPGGENYRELLLTMPPKAIQPEIGAPEPVGRDGEAMWQGRHRVSGVMDYPVKVPGGADGRITYWPKTYNSRGEEGPPKWVVYTRDIQNAQMDSMAAARDAIVQGYERAGRGGPDRSDTYRSTHWNEPNVLAHVRFDDRTDAEGRKVLHVAEIQSDWHQAGRKHGYQRGEPAPHYTVIDNFGHQRGYFGTEQEARDYITDPTPLPVEYMHNAQVREVPGHPSGVPDAPFKTTWPELAMKRVLRFGAENGYDRVTWDTGATNVARYGDALQNHVDRIEWEKTPEGVHLIGSKRGQDVIDTHEKETALSDAIGKSMADKILADPAQTGTIKGRDIAISDTGMAGFYDKILPNIANKLGKRFGAKVGQSEIREGKPTTPDATARRDHAQALADIDAAIVHNEAAGYYDEEYGQLREERENIEARMMQDTEDRARSAGGHTVVHTTDITPAMRDSVMQGQPLFLPRQLVTVRNERETERWTPADLRAYTNVGRVVETKPWRERLAAATDDLGRRLIRATLDPYIGVKTDDPSGYMALRNANTTAGAVEMFLIDGTLKFDGSTYAMAERNGGVEHSLIRPLHGEQDRFLWWVAAHRADRLAAEDRENLWSEQDIDTIKGKNQGQVEFAYRLPNGQITHSREAIYLDSLRKLDGFNKNVLDLAVQSGLLDGDKVRALFSNPFYVPFYRVADDGHFAGPNVTSGFVKQYAFKSLKGGAQKLNNDLWDNAIKNWSHMIDASLRNKAASAVLDVAQTNGAVTERSTRQYDMMGKAEKQSTVWVMNNGQRQYFQVHDPMLYTAISALSFQGLRGPFMTAATKFKTLLTQGVTADPRFALRLSIRDAEQAMATGASYNAVNSIYRGFKMGDLPGALRNVARAVAGQETQRLKLSDEAADLIAGGGTMRLGSGHDTGGRKTDLATMLDNPASIGAFWHRVSTIARAYKEVTAQAEDSQRFAIYHKLIGEGVPHDQASYAARDLEDFTLKGAGAVVRTLTQMVPFMNAWLQGLYKLGRSAADQDRNLAVAVGQRFAVSTAKRVGVVLATTTLLTLALDAIYKDDEDYKKRPEYDRNSNFWFKFGGTQFRIPMGFEIAALSRIAANGVEAFFGANEMTARRFVNNVGSIFATNMSMMPVPQIVRPVWDLYANKTATGSPIISEGMDALRSEEQYTPQSTLFARWISSAGNAAARTIGGPQASFLAPIQLDYLVNGYFGWLGSHVINMADLAVRAADQAQAAARGAKPEYPERPNVDLWNYAFGGMISTEPTPQSRYVDLLYQQAAGINRAWATYHDILARGHPADAAAFYAANKDQIVKHQLMQNVTKEESTFGQQVKRIGESDKSAEQKRLEIQRYNAMRNRAAENIFGARP